MKISLFLKIALFINENNRERVLRFKNSDGPFGPAVGDLLNKAAASFDKTIQPRPWREGKTCKPGLRPVEMHPFCLRHLHLKVKRLTMICASLSLLQIMFAVHPGGGGLLSTQRLPPIISS